MILRWKATPLLLALAFVACGGRPAATVPTPASSVVVPASTPVAYPTAWPHTPTEGSVTGVHGMVSSDATLASRVGQEILASGGNAVDTAVAVAFALAVVHPSAGNVGGGGFMVARMSGATYALDFRETAPAKATRTMFLGPDGKPTDASHDGLTATGVPGSVAGLHAAFTKLGSKKKTWAELLAPAIRLAEEGFTVDGGLAKAFADSQKRIGKFPGTAALYYAGGAPPAEGSRWKNPELATVLKRVAVEGPKGFYEGPTADAIAAEMTQGGGLVTKDDLKGYQAKWRAPVEFTYRGKRVISMPPPSSGGVTLGMIARILEGYDLKALPWHSAPEIHLMTEAMRRAFAARNSRLGDPDFVTNPTSELLSDGWAQSQRATLDRAKVTPSASLATPGPASGVGPHTTHFSVVDGEGNAVALTTTVNWWFGNGIVVRGTGFVLNNEMDDFAAKPGVENGFGLVQGEPNAVEPGKRMLSSMAPTLVLDGAADPKAPGGEGKVVLVLGAAGGPTIITAVFGILSSVVDHGLDVSTAANAPRFHHQHLPDVLVHEKNGLPEDVAAQLKALGHELKEREHLADAPAIGWSPGAWIGAPEVRRRGAHAAGW